METNENQWKSMEINNQWKPMETKENRWKSMEITGNQ